MLLLSPYFLLSASHKALEWLIYRYGIHEYNRDDFIMLILPYHESNIFVRALQLIKIEENDRWLWLKPLQKPGIRLPKSVLYKQAASDVHFLQFISNNLLTAIKEHEKPSYLSVLLNFYCSVFTCALDYTNEVKETHVQQMLPCLLKGLKSDISNFTAASYIITSKLIMKATLSDKILTKIVEKASTINSGLYKEALALLVLIYQSQEQFEVFPRGALQNLQGKEFTDELQYLIDEGYIIRPFVTPFLKSLFQSALEEVVNDNYKKFADFLMERSHFNDEVMEDFMNVLLEIYDLDLSYSTETTDWFKKLFVHIERQSPLLYDREVSKVLKPTDDETALHKQAVFKKVVSKSSSVELFEQLYHPSAGLRQTAVSSLISRENLTERERDFIKNALIDRLNDDDQDVVKETLNLGEQIMRFIENDALKAILLDLLLKKSDSVKISIKALKLLVKLAGNDQDVKLFLVTLPFTVQTDKTRELLASTKWNESKFTSSELISTINNLKIENALHRYLSTTVLVDSVPENCDVKESQAIFEVMMKFFTSSKVKISKGDFIEAAKRNHLPLDGFLINLTRLISKTQNVTVEHYDFHSEGKFLLILLDFLIKGAFSAKHSIATLYSTCLKSFFDHFCDKDDVKKQMLLLNIIAATNSAISPVLKLRCAKCFLAAVTKTDVTIGSNFTAFLIAALRSELKEVRSVLLEAINLLLKKKKVVILADILNRESEILADPEQIFSSNKKLDYVSLIDVIKDAPVYIRTNVVKAVKGLNDAKIYRKLVTLLPMIESDLNVINVEALHVLIEAFGGCTMKISKTTDELWSFMAAILKIDSEVSFGFNFTPSALLLSKIDKTVYDNLNNEVKIELINAVIQLSTDSVNPEILPAAAKFFKHIELDIEFILPHLIKMRDVQSAKVNAIKNKRRVVIPTTDILDTSEWKKGVTVLEFLQDKKKIQNYEKLVPTLFEILKKCLDFEEQTNVEYPKQLILTTVLHVSDKIDNLEGVFNVELIVQCVRVSQNPQTHHHALLLLAHCGKYVPKQVLQHIITIFTFMGSSVLRQDDAYSFQIITRIMETIIPILVSDKHESVILNVLRVFVDAILDVPEHRRLLLYTNLLDKIGNENLHLFLLLIFEGHVLHSGKKRLEIASNLLLTFNVEDILINFITLMKYLKDLPEDKDEPHLIETKHHTPKQYRHFKFTIITFVGNFLSSRKCVDKMAALSSGETLSLEDLFKTSIVNILTYVQTLSKLAEKGLNTPQAQYYKVMLHHTYDALDSLNALLTSEMFLLVTKGLMSHGINPIKRRSLELLNAKLQIPNFFDGNSEELLALIPTLLTVIKTETNCNEEEIIKQTGLLTLKLLTKLLAIENIEQFTPLLAFTTDLIKSKNSNNVLASSVLCLAELCAALRAHSISQLNKFMPALIKIMKGQKKEETVSLLLLSVVTAFSKILDNLALFISPYLDKLLIEVCDVSIRHPTFTKLNSVKQKLAQLVPPHVLIPSIEETFSVAIQKNPKTCSTLMEILSASVSHLKGTNLNNNLAELTTFFINALQYRADNEIELELANEVEGNVIKALVSLVLKLSESNFRPLYYKLYDWAARNENSERLITFYSITAELASNLKSLFVLFAGNFLNNAAGLLKERIYEDEDKYLLLLTKIIDTLSSVFQYDNQKFVNKDRFDLLVGPLVDQLDNAVGDYEQRASKLIIPCIVNFTTATGDDALWKQMNYQILLKMRDTSPNVRLIALECLKEVVKKLGDDFLPLLPETIPFLAELLEDEEETVEKACQKTVQELEKILGESLQKYF